MPFSKPQISQVSKVFSCAEGLIAGYFRMTPDDLRANPYDVKTLRQLEKHEVSDTAFAHLCKYVYKKKGQESTESEIPFYRVCLQDNRILYALERGTPFIQFSTLMTYIAVHELVHVVRFNRGESDFELSPREREIEEEKVHSITRNILHNGSGPGLGLVLDCFSSKYQKIN